MTDNRTLVPKTQWSKRVRSIDGNTCYICKSSESDNYHKRLEAHHIKPKSVYPFLAFDLNNGICLCHNCHMLVHMGRYSDIIDNFSNTHIAISFSIKEINTIKAHADAMGESLNAFIRRAISETMERDRETEAPDGPAV